MDNNGDREKVLLMERRWMDGGRKRARETERENEVDRASTVNVQGVTVNKLTVLMSKLGRERTRKIKDLSPFQ